MSESIQPAKMPRLLLLDTCGLQATVALAAGAGVVAQVTLPGRECSSQLLPQVRRMLDEAGWPPASLAAIVVASGPGSFTGIRIGLSFAKGLSAATGVPLIAVSRLETLAAVARSLRTDEAGCLRVAFDAGRGEAYLRRECAGDEPVEMLVTVEAMVADAAAQPVSICEDVLAGPGRVQIAPPDAAAMLPLALARLQAGSFDEAALLDGNYVRGNDQIFAKPAAPRDRA